MCGQSAQVVGDFRNQDCVRSSGDSSLEGNVPGIASHDLDDHDAVVAFGCSLDVIDGVNDRIERGFVANGQIGIGDVVIDCFGDRDEIDFPGIARFFRAVVVRVDLRQFPETPIAADDDKSVQAERPIGVTKGLVEVWEGFRSVGEGRRVEVFVAAQERPSRAGPLVVADVRRQVDRLERTDPYAPIASLESDDLPVEGFRGMIDDRPDGRVQTWAVSSADKNSDFLFGIRALGFSKKHSGYPFTYLPERPQYIRLCSTVIRASYV